MGSQRMSQLDKWDKKWGKAREYEQIVMDKRKSDEPEVDIRNEEKLMEKGNLKEAAAVFSLEGISLFLDMFQTSMEKAVQGALQGGVQKMVEDAVDKRMNDVLEGMTEGLRRFAESQVQNSVTSSIEQAVQLKMSNPCEPSAGAEEPTQEQAITSESTVTTTPVINMAAVKILTLGKACMNQYMPAVKAILDEKYIGKAFMAKDLNADLRARHSVMWGTTEISKVLRKLNDYGISITMVSKGVYIYSPKTREQ